MKRVLFLIIAALMVVACTNGKTKIHNGSEGVCVKPEPVNDLFGNEEWLDKLVKDRGKLKEGWLSWFNPYDFSDDEHMEDSYIIKEGDNTAILYILPVVNYLIRYQAFMKWNGKDSIESLVELSKTTAYGFIVKGDTIIGAVDYARQDSTWKATGWGPFDKKSAAFLSDLYFKEKKRFVLVSIEGSDEPKTYLRQYLVYKENGEYRLFHSGGSSSRLIDNLIEGQRNNKAGVIW